jgi:hypothetical protein
LASFSGGQNFQLIFGLTAVGYGWRFVCDQANDIYRLNRMVAGADTTLASNSGATANCTRLWVYFEPSGTTGMQIWCYAWTGGAWVLQCNYTDTYFGVVASQYFGLRISGSQSVALDNLGGGSLGKKGNATPAIATASALPAGSMKSLQGICAPATATASAPAGNSKMAALTVVALSTAVAMAGVSTMRASAAPPGISTSTAAPAVGHTDVPVFPPIPPPTPPPPAPPPDPRDVPAIDGPFTYILYNAMLPLAWADEFTGWPMLNFFKSICYIVHEPYALAVDPGWELILNVDDVPSKFLDWLAQVVGIPVLSFTNLSNPDKRAMIHDAPGWKRGTLQSMIKAAQFTLTGNKTVIVYERYDTNFPGQDRAYHITFITYLSQTPDQAKTLAALIAAKPAGLQLTLLSRSGQIWQWLRDHYPPTTQRLWSNAKADYADWEHVRDVTYY